jgi:hypothetical protein
MQSLPIHFLILLTKATLAKGHLMILLMMTSYKVIAATGRRAKLKGNTCTSKGEANGCHHLLLNL